MNESPSFHRQQPGQTVAASATSEGLSASELSAIAYLKQVYALLGGSLLLATAAGYVAMGSPLVQENLLLLIIAEVIVFFVALAKRNSSTLFLFTGISGLTLGPVLDQYVHAGMPGIIGQAVFMTGAVFVGLTFHALTTRRDFSAMGGMLFAGLIVLLVGSLVNIFLQSTGLAFAVSAAGTLIFSGYILWETQQLKNHPWEVPPAAAALSLYLNVLNLFLSLLRLLGILSSDD
ncbi:MAG: Bax inhibitor-1/YccA family protein [Magnetococcales bacterium]|nr:Bax inhibitor-1/YccA family protein [Magnetococcales bacterium]MBF0156737.1 Bax inhibitor-1/YccA family protein [Magnetococcales bacterium]